MNKSRPDIPQALLTGATATLAALVGENACPAAHAPTTPDVTAPQRCPEQRFAFHREHVLGTAFEMLVNSIRPEDACLCEQQVLAEIERLRQILSTYDPGSEINRVRAGAPVVSAELAGLLSAYDQWNDRTSGAINVNMAEVIRLWKEAHETKPTPQALGNALAQPLAYNVDALGKGFIIDRAVAVAQRFAPSGLLNIGGDIRVWGAEAWRIGVANPFAPAENAPLLASFTLRHGAVATSGGYSRFFTLAGQRHSHILDPRTLQPVCEVSSASMVAADCLTANALATAANVLGLSEGVRLAKLFGAWEYLLANAQGRIESSIALTTMADTTSPAVVVPTAAVTPAPAAPPELPAGPAVGVAWPTNFQVNLDLTLKTASGGRVKRPYIAVWVEDAKTNLVRTVTVWGSDWRWLKELNTWWRVTDKYTDAYAQSITRATRAPGNYQIVWDGLDDKKQPVPQGDYKIFLEINREHGRHATESIMIKCGNEAQTAEFRATPESEVAKVEYGLKLK